MSEDEELEYLKRKKLLEMRRRLLVEKAAETRENKGEDRKAGKPREVLKTVFADSAWEVWQAAEQQYPQVAEEVARALAALVEAGKMREKVTGEQLYWLFTELGLQLRFAMRIRIFESGELKTIADKLREK